MGSPPLHRVCHQRCTTLGGGGGLLEVLQPFTTTGIVHHQVAAAVSAVCCAVAGSAVRACERAGLQRLEGLQLNLVTGVPQLQGLPLLPKRSQHGKKTVSHNMQ